MTGKFYREPGKYAWSHFESEKGRQETKRQIEISMISLDRSTKLCIEVKLEEILAEYGNLLQL